jgi:hypothetical protein
MTTRGRESMVIEYLGKLTSKPYALEYALYLFEICCLFNGAISSSNYIAKNNTINELEWTWKYRGLI